jgi:hypothetical protein
MKKELKYVDGVIVEAKKYPTQQDAEYLVNYVHGIRGLSTGGLSSQITKLHNKIVTIHQKEWNRVFGDDSPWAVRYVGNKGKAEVYWKK